MENVNKIEIEKQEVGKVSETEIAEISVGTGAEIYPPALLENSKYPIDVNKRAIAVRTKNGAVEYFAYPEFVHVKSKLFAFSQKYGKFPEIGMKVYTQTDQSGFEKLVF